MKTVTIYRGSEEREITQQEWARNGKKLRDAGWSRDKPSQPTPEPTPPPPEPTPPPPAPEPPKEPEPEEPPVEPEPPEMRPPAAVQNVEIVAGENEGKVAFKLTWDPPEDTATVDHYRVVILRDSEYFGHIDTTEREMVLEPDPVATGQRSPTYQTLVHAFGNGLLSSPEYSKRFEVDMVIREVKILPEGPHKIKVGETKQLHAKAYAKGGRVTY